MSDKELKIKISTEDDPAGLKSTEKSIQDLKKELKQLREEMKSIPVVSDAFKEAAVKVNAAEKALKDATRAAANNGNQVGALGDSYSGFGGQLRNVSYQLQDFFVQVSSGQGVMRALSQQLPQLLSGFGLFGVVMGAAASVAPLLFSAFSGGGDKVKEETDKAGTAIDDFKERLEKIAEAKANKFLTDYAKLFEDVAKYAKDANEEIDRFNKLTQSGLDSELKLAEAKAKSDKAAIDADPSLTDAQKITQKAKIDDDLANTTERIKKEKIDADQNAKEKNNEVAQDASARESKNYEMARLAREEKEKELKILNETKAVGDRAKSSLEGLRDKKSASEANISELSKMAASGSLDLGSYEKLSGEEQSKLADVNKQIDEAENQFVKGVQADAKINSNSKVLDKLRQEESEKAKSAQAAKEAAEKSAKDIGNTRAIAENEKQTIAGESRFGREARTSETDSALNKAQKKASDEAERNADKARREQERKERDAERERERRAKVEADGPSIAFSAADQARGLGLSEDKVRYLEQIGKQIALPGDGSKAGTDDQLMQRLLSIVESIVNNAPKNGKSATDEAKKMRDLKERIDNLEKRVTRNSKMF